MGFSDSGNQMNIVEGLKQVVAVSLDAWAIIGFDGGSTKKWKN